MASTVNPKNAKDCPVLKSEASISYWLDQLAIWQLSVDLDAKKMVPYIVNTAIKVPAVEKRVIAGWRKNQAAWIAEDGMQKFVKWLKVEFSLEGFSEKSQRLMLFLRLSRAATETYRQFLLRFQERLDELERDSCSLVAQDYLLNIVLYSGLRMTHAESQLIRTTIDLETDTHTAVVRALENQIFEHALGGAEKDTSLYVGDGDVGAYYGEGDVDAYYDGEGIYEWVDDGDVCATDGPNSDVYAAPEDTSYAVFYKQYPKGGKNDYRGGGKTWNKHSKGKGGNGQSSSGGKHKSNFGQNGQNSGKGGKHYGKNNYSGQGKGYYRWVPFSYDGWSGGWAYYGDAEQGCAEDTNTETIEMSG
jgi:uncharacterized membrane protein YgcG